MLFCCPQFIITKQLGKKLLQWLVHRLQIFEQFEGYLLFVKDVIQVFRQFLIKDIPHQFQEPRRSEFSCWLFHLSFNPLVSVENEPFCWSHSEGSSIVAVCGELIEIHRGQVSLIELFQSPQNNIAILVLHSFWKALKNFPEVDHSPSKRSLDDFMA